MKARKCPASRNCTAWSGTMKLNRICFSEIASGMIKGAAGRRWWSPSTEATSVTPSFTRTCFGFFSFFAYFLWLQSSSPPPGPFHLCVVPLLWAWKQHQAASESRELVSTIPWVHEFAQIHQVLRLPLTHTQHSSFPWSLIIVFWVKIWPFSSIKLIHIMQHRVPSSARWNRTAQVGAAPCSATAPLFGSAVGIPLCISFSS